VRSGPWLGSLAGLKLRIVSSENVLSTKMAFCAQSCYDTPNDTMTSLVWHAKCSLRVTLRLSRITVVEKAPLRQL
jgi:hypothetical protein